MFNILTNMSRKHNWKDLGNKIYIYPVGAGCFWLLGAGAGAGAA